MNPQATDKFYSNLPLYDLTINQLVKDQEHFTQVPEDWHVVVTDVKDSTGAIRLGQHQTVNLVATGSIISGLNIARKTDLKIPFFFGGDGATLLVPPSLVGPIIIALKEHSENVKNNFNLELRVGQLQVSEVLRNQHHLSISKVKINHDLDIPVVLGDGLQYVESVLKGSGCPELDLGEGAPLDLSGMECRWDQIEPPDYRQEVVCLLVVARNSELSGLTYAKVLDIIDEVYGLPTARNPITVPKLKLKASLAQLATEIKVKHGTLMRWQQITGWLQTLLGHYYLKFNQQGRYYTNKLVEMSETLVIDGRINTVISGTREQRQHLIERLDELESKEEVIFGWHVSNSSIMSCYVRDRIDKHVHFVDGAGGGYTKAASMLKNKLSQT